MRSLVALLRARPVAAAAAGVVCLGVVATLVVARQSDPAPTAQSPDPTPTVVSTSPTPTPTPAPASASPTSASAAASSASATTSSPAPRPSPKQTRSTRSTAPAVVHTAPPVAGGFVEPSLVGTKLLGCRHDGDNEWTVSFQVTVRGGSSWRFSDSNSQTMGFTFSLRSTISGTGGTTTATYDQHVSWIASSDGSGAPDEFDEKVPWYAITDEEHDRAIGVKLPAAHQLTAHCSK
jgi:hypothetical protein